jgi:hypothetical protein
MFRKIIFLLIFVLIAGPASGFVHYENDVKEKLKTVVYEKRDQLSRFCDSLTQKVRQIENDERMRSFFKINNEFFQLNKKFPAPPEYAQKVDQLEASINQYYLKEYIEFYDILFVNHSGDIFYTIRKEQDYHKNIFEGDLAKTSLSENLKKGGDSGFVDFQYFFPSDEPAAFFVVPVEAQGENLGWFILQCSINKVNSLFLGYEGLGNTGEVFLVNKDQFMLTNSRFIGNSTILRQHLDAENIKAKFKEKNGFKVVRDYRGFRALSYFEVFEFLDAEWLIIAKVDEAEILTDFFAKDEKKLLPAMLASIKMNVFGSGSGECGMMNGSKVVKMDEFKKSTDGKKLSTFGLSTCTGFIASYPNNFAYLAHISPNDDIYSIGEKVYTNLVGQILKRIRNFDIYQYQRRHLKFYVVSNNVDALTNLINKLLRDDILLSQIYVIYDEGAKCNAFCYDHNRDSFCARIDKSDKSFVKTTENLQSLEYYLVENNDVHL